MSPTKAAQAEATRRKLIQAGRRLFARRGFNAVAADEIVAAANVTRGALYHHFDGKDGLFRVVVSEAMAEVKVRVMRSPSAAASPLARVEAGLHVFLEAITEPGLQRVLLIDGPAVLGWQQWRALDLENGLGLLRAGLQAAVTAGEVAVPDVETATHLLAGAIVDGAMLIGQDPRNVSVRRQVEATLVEILRGLAPVRT
jgi:AcrR family transcriptional regulator